ncbi:MAG: hypothetical protein WB474_11240 [Nitrososphaeraceae archaeon]
MSDIYNKNYHELYAFCVKLWDFIKEVYYRYNGLAMHDGIVGNQEQSGMHSDRTNIKMVTKLIRHLKNIFEKKLGVRLSG